LTRPIVAAAPEGTWAGGLRTTPGSIARGRLLRACRDDSDHAGALPRGALDSERSPERPQAVEHVGETRARPPRRHVAPRPLVAHHEHQAFRLFTDLNLRRCALARVLPCVLQGL